MQLIQGNFHAIAIERISDTPSFFPAYMNPNTPHALSVYLDGITCEADANVDSISYSNFKKLILILKQEIIKKIEELPNEESPLVAILLPTGPIAYACIVACLDLSICYVPLNTSNSNSYNFNILEQVKPTVIVCSPNNKYNNRPKSSILLKLEENQVISTAEQASYDELYESTVIRSKGNYNSDTAYMIFTSGSTGDPKGSKYRGIIYLNTSNGFIAVSLGVIEMESSFKQLLSPLTYQF